MFLAWLGLVKDGELCAIWNQENLLSCLPDTPLSTILAFLTDDYPSTSTSYSVSCGSLRWLTTLTKKLPISRAYALVDGATIRHDGYRLSLVPGVSFSVAREPKKARVIYDVQGWFSAEETGELAGKLRALSEVWQAGDADGAKADVERMASAPALQRDAANLLVLRLREYHRGCSSLGEYGRLSRWNGPGALASSLMRGAAVRPQLRKFTEEKTPARLYDAFSRAFFGGRIETLKLGGCNAPVWRYDLNSAYGWGLADTWPTSGYWFPATGGFARSLKYSVWLIRWKVPSHLSHIPGPFPYRLASGGVVFPAQGRGWYWWPEVQAALERLPKGAVVVEGGYYHAATRPSRLGLLAKSIYSCRRDAQDTDPTRQRVLKLVLPALWGKLAQRKGRPQFACLPLAGYVTSKVRARLWEATVACADTILQYSTDSVYSTRPLDLPISDALGDWKVDQFSSAIFVRPGVSKLVHPSGAVTLKTQGFDCTPREFDDLLGQLQSLNGATYSVPCFVSHALIRAAATPLASQLGQTVQIPYHINPYGNMRRLYDWRQYPENNWQRQPIIDWQNDLRDSVLLPGGPELSQRHDVAYPETDRKAPIYEAINAARSA